jgi:23S rRNA (cytosine1962-C5)-methyltransferase
MVMTSTTSLAEIHLKPRKALPFFSHHPWVYDTAIAEVTGDPAPGGAVVLRSAEGRFVAHGLYNPHSKVRVRLYSWREDQPLDDALWRTRLGEAVALRRRLYGDLTSDAGCRLVYSEADQLSGLVVDRYGDWLVIQFTSLAMAARRDVIVETLKSLVAPRGIYLRTEKGIGKMERLEIEDGLLWGEPPPRPLFLSENGIRYGVDLAEGQKTGFFLDQRDNRRRLAEFVRGGRVLDLFCYSGGFSLNALVHGAAREVVAIDGSDGAVRLAQANADLNGVAARFKVTKEDAFRALERLAGEGQRFDAVIVDPPKMARRRDALDAALRGYFSLNRLAVDVLEPGGLLMTCSCSGVVTHQHFVEILARVSLDSGRHLQLLEARGPSADHPASVHCLESDYLKCYLCRVL